MLTFFEEMYSLLTEQKKIQQEMLELSYEKRQAALKNDTDKLNEIVRHEMKYLSALNSVDKKRIIILEKISKVINVPEKDFNLSVLIEHSRGELRERFVKIQKEMHGLLKAQAEINSINKILLETQLEYTNAMLNIIVGPEDPLNNIYSDDGRSAGKDTKKSAGLFDKQV